ncbi:hypothetical protein M3N55_15520 [Roseibaca sp. V10]|uniref:Uncharacterized protein n=1 Tax=Roseinatronobacter domitianus TaxID=2940293 RepID=A0ABT0M656_9RHOB|nr:hypothetical protein [Roseibaca domitiana]MCL1630133.1 hypothetical protein [Roseibaca domitiana]
MSQTRSMSAIEAVANTVIGWGVALATQLVAFPAVGLQATPWQHVTISLAFTSVSVMRSYLLRRLFARLD